MARICLLTRAILHLPIDLFSRAILTCCDPTWTCEANVITKMLLIPASVAIRGKMRKPGIETSWCNVMHAKYPIISMIGTQKMVAGMTAGRRYALNDFSKIWTYRYKLMQTSLSGSERIEEISLKIILKMERFEVIISDFDRSNFTPRNVNAYCFLRRCLFSPISEFLHTFSAKSRILHVIFRILDRFQKLNIRLTKNYFPRLFFLIEILKLFLFKNYLKIQKTLSCWQLKLVKKLIFWVYFELDFGWFFFLIWKK